MGFNTRRPPGYRRPQLSWFETLGNAAESHARGGSFRWKCRGCQVWSDLDFDDYLSMEGPRFPTWNLLSECPSCHGPRTLYASPARATPFQPMTDGHLWVLAEIGYGRDPDAWFEIDFME